MDQLTKEAIQMQAVADAARAFAGRVPGMLQAARPALQAQLAKVQPHIQRGIDAGRQAAMANPYVAKGVGMAQQAGKDIAGVGRAAAATPTGQAVGKQFHQGAWSAPEGAGTLRKLVHDTPFVGLEAQRHALLGSPATMAQQIKSQGLGNYYRSAFIPRNADGSVNMLGTALGVGLPAVQLGMAAFNPENRGRNMGAAAASLAAAPFLGQTGAAGRLLGQHVISRAGGAVGGMFDRRPAPPQDDEYQLPPGYARMG